MREKPGQFGRGSWVCGVAVAIAAVGGLLARPRADHPSADDRVRRMQVDAEAAGAADWGHLYHMNCHSIP